MVNSPLTSSSLDDDVELPPQKNVSSPPLLSELIFPTASQNIAHTLSALSARTLSIRNRLHSINSDAQFVQDVAVAYPECVVIANERCGAWYVEAGLKGTTFTALSECEAGVEGGHDGRDEAEAVKRKSRGSAYFKSTDGHAGQWNFSLRRLNLQVLEALGTFGGAILVDSTRRGKHLPDALSKAVPIWCAVLNRLLFPGASFSEYHHISRVSELVSDSEHAQMEARLEGWVEAAEKLDLNLPHLRAVLNNKPLRPSFIARSLDLHPLPPHIAARQPSVHNLPYHPLYLTMASLYQPTSYSHTDSENSIDYVQGAGDDNEMWSQGMTSEQWWRWRDVLLNASDDELPDLIARLLSEDTAAASQKRSSAFTYISATQRALAIGGLPLNGVVFEAESNVETAVLIACCDEEELVRVVPEVLQKRLGKRLLHLKCGTGKLGSRDLRKELPKLSQFISSCLTISNLASDESNGNTNPAESPVIARSSINLQVYIADTTSGKDIATGVALALLALYSDNDGHIDWSTPRQQRIDKTSIRKKLSWITTDMPSANPSRATLNAVNEFVMR